jgi:hypothetical protein
MEKLRSAWLVHANNLCCMRDTRQANSTLVPRLRVRLRMAASDFVSQHHALLALGWVTALRRSELVGLDCGNVGAGTGYLRIEWKAPPMVGGASTAILYGDPTKPGVYVTRTKFWASRVWTVSAPFWCPVQWLK